MAFSFSTNQPAQALTSGVWRESVETLAKRRNRNKSSSSGVMSLPMAQDARAGKDKPQAQKKSSLSLIVKRSCHTT
jgi:hypothetical protein